jgi:putative DNA methylase
MSHKRRLIEHRLPLEKISEASAREKSIRHGHISTLHIWWARRPLAASRAAVFATLVPDTEENYQLVKKIVPWEAVKDGNSKDILEARRRVLEASGGTPPRVLDPFAGGGAIPLEALRLGCETHALDLNPVAYLILKATLEYPQRFGQPDSRAVPTYIRALDQAHAQAKDQAAQGTTRLLEEGGKAQEEGPFSKAYRENPLAAEVRYWGEWVLERARQELAQFYPKDPDGRTPVAYLWARTVTCTNPTCRAEVPLVRQWWLAKRDKKRIALKPLVDREAERVDFQVVEVPQGEDWPDQGTVQRGNAACLVCGTAIPASETQKQAKERRWGERLLAVVLGSGEQNGKTYRVGTPEDIATFEQAKAKLEALKQRESPFGELPLIPNEPIPYEPRAFTPCIYGFQEWGQLFNPRQALALVTFAKWVREAHAEMLKQGMDEELAKAVATYLGITVDRLADRCSSLTHWDNPYEKIANTFARQALPMVWDYAELNPFSGSTGDYEGAIEWVGLVIRHAALAAPQPGVVHRGTATRLPFPDGYFDAVVTDPPLLRRRALRRPFGLLLRVAPAHGGPPLSGALPHPPHAQGAGGRAEPRAPRGGQREGQALLRGNDGGGLPGDAPGPEARGQGHRRSSPTRAPRPGRR